MTRSATWWVRIALINLCIVALYGTVMRYKIGFELPWLDQKYLQEAHSHFAFAGWISHSLFFLMVRLFHSNLERIRLKRYNILIVLNLVSAYGMLVAFTYQGYGPISLTFSSLSVLVAYVFSYDAWKDAGRLPPGHPSRNWIRAAVFLAILSTIGTMVLSQMMATKQYDQTTYLGSIYFYLHFQYNGWFLFACIGLFMDRIRHLGLDPKYTRYVFWCFFLAGIPAYFLSTLWAKLPLWIYAIVVAAAILQVIGWWFLFKMVRQHAAQLKALFSRVVLLLFSVVGLALTLKLFLQLGSTIPEVSKLAFGFRPVVIAYLHLVLLLIISVFLLTYFAGSGLLKANKASGMALGWFTASVILKEIILAVQGIGAFSYTVIPLANELLFVMALLILLSAILLALAQFRNRFS